MAPDLADGRRPPLTRAQRLGLAGVCVVVVLAYLPAIGAGMWGDDLNWVFGAVRAVDDPLTVLEVQHNFFRPTEQLYFLAVLLGSLLFRDKRSEEMWPEVYARQNTGILVSKAASH